MHKRLNLTAVLIAAVLAAMSLASIATGQNHLITPDSIGDIRIGSTVGDVRSILKGTAFTRGPGEGVDEIEVKQNGKTVMWLTAQAGDENYDAPVKNSTEIIGIDVLDPKYRTADGIGVGTTVKTAANIYGALKHIWIEGLTGNEYATFRKHPDGIDFGVAKSLANANPEERAGIYVGDNNTTAVFVEGAVISSISIPGSYGKDFLNSEIKLITPTNAGDIRIGMTVSEARAAINKTMIADFKRTSDGEGIALVSVSVLGKELMTLYAGEDDPKKPIDDSKKIEFIEVWNAGYQTKEGVTPKMLLTNAEQIYGEVRSISVSELEFRQTVKFERQPPGLTFRVSGKDSKTGVYGDGRMQTGSFDPGAMILSIQISRIPNTTAPESGSQNDFLIKDASANFEMKIGIRGCDSEICEGAALVQLFRKGEAQPFQTITMGNMYLELRKDRKPTVNLIELYGMNNSGVVFDDFDFDGQEDVALRNGNNGAYGGPSYDVFLYSNNLFTKNSSLTKLASENLGLFKVDKEKKQLETFNKSGCCWHQTTRYRVAYGIPRVVSVRTEDAMRGDGKVVVTTETLVDGRWKKTVKTKDMEEGN